MNDESQVLQSLIQRIHNLEESLKSFRTQEPNAPVVLAANRFVLLDPTGTEKATLSAPDNTSTALLMYDVDGNPRLFAGLEDKGATIALYDANETPLVKLTVNDALGGSAISIHNSKGKAQISLTSAEGEPVRVALHDKDGQHRVDLFYAEDSDCTGGAVTIKDSTGGRVMITDCAIAVMDPTGKLLFYAPQSHDADESGKTPAQVYLYKNGQQNGPYSIEQVKAWIASGQLSREDQIWYEGASGWAAASSIPGLVE